MHAIEEGKHEFLLFLFQYGLSANTIIANMYNASSALLEYTFIIAAEREQQQKDTVFLASYSAFLD